MSELTRNTITAAMARELGLAPITSSYSRREHDLLERAVLDQRAAGSIYALVRTRDGIAIWKAGTVTGREFAKTYGDGRVAR